MPHRLRPVLAVFRAALASGALGLLMLAAAIATAWLRYEACGPSRLAAAEAACRTGVQLLFAAYVVLGIALVLGAISLTLLWRVRRQGHGRP